jgi:aminoglycoside 3-N-acetyltransferase
MNCISKEQMVHDLHIAGINPGDIILLHSALSSIGFAEGGAEAVADALLEAVGPEGTVASITMNGIGVFDAATSPSNVGIISETLRKRPDAVRSLRPVHSVTAIGKRAVEFIKDHDKAKTNCGEGTPYCKIRDMGGKIVLLGVDQNRNTTLHALEDIINAPYLEEVTLPAPTYIEDYQNKTMHITQFPPGHRDFLSFTKVLRENDAMTEGKVGNAVVKVIDAKKMFKLGLDILNENPAFFMCSNKMCDYCNRFNTED